ncbi:RDD family protein [Pseudoduganella sp.]|uniref:RDD family protein n=1 Tax=Pseudoduganella sp. TaxID=1880898 RepID=UPI0035B23664
MTFREKCQGLETEELLNKLRLGLVEGAQAIVLEVLKERGVSDATIERVLASEAARQEEEAHQQARMASQGIRLLAFGLDFVAATLVLGLLTALLQPIAGAAEPIVLALWWGYMLLRDAIPGGSLGKHLLKLRVVRIPGERRMTLGASFFRNLTHAFFLIDALFILGERRMRLGDMLAGTIVLRRDAPGARTPLAASPPAP